MTTVKRILGIAARRADGTLVVALIPAHNEEDQIAEAIRSLHEQESPPELIVVCADNCTDGTAREAEAAGAFVYETVGNAHKKAGALNQALELLLPELEDDDAVLVLDADSFLAPTFVSEARQHLRGLPGTHRPGPYGARARSRTPPPSGPRPFGRRDLGDRRRHRHPAYRCARHHRAPGGKPARHETHPGHDRRLCPAHRSCN